MSVDEDVDKDEDMKYSKGQDGVSIMTFQISEIVEKLGWSPFHPGHYKVCPPEDFQMYCATVFFNLEVSELGREFRVGLFGRFLMICKALMDS